MGETATGSQEIEGVVRVGWDDSGLSSDSLDQSTLLAQRLLTEETTDDAARVRRAFTLVLNRPRTDQEIDEATNYLDQ